MSADMSSQNADYESTLDEGDYQIAVSDLCELLNANINVMSFSELSKLVKKRAKSWHPDKNRDNPRKIILEENLKRLNGAWSVYKCFKNLIPEESVSSDDCSGGESSYFESPYFSQEFFNVSPSKSYDFPLFVKDFFRSENCRRAGKTVLICIPLKHFDLDLFFSCHFITDHYAIYQKDNLFIISIYLTNELRYFDIKKKLKLKLTTFKCNFSIKYSKLQTALTQQCGNAIKEEGEYQKPKINNDKSFSPFLLADYAKKQEIVNTFELMAEYSHFSSKTCSFNNPSQDHIEYHEIHHENSVKYVHLSDQKKFAKNAIDVVKADQFMKHKKIKNSEFLENKIIEISHNIDIISGLIEKLSFHAYFFIEIICKSNSHEMMNCFKHICESYFEGKPKDRYTALVGDYNCGKSTIGFAFLSLFSGKTINCNVEFSRLGFFLGEALDQRFILFDDVSPKGMKNLDELRDHLDGRIPVLLEKKNVQPVMQTFPAGIITSNYSLSPPLKIRVKEYTLKSFELKGHEYDFDSNVLFIILVIWNLIPTESSFMRQVTDAKHKWKTYHVKECSFCQNVLK